MFLGRLQSNGVNFSLKIDFLLQQLLHLTITDVQRYLSGVGLLLCVTFSVVIDVSIFLLLRTNLGAV